MKLIGSTVGWLEDAPGLRTSYIIRVAWKTNSNALLKKVVDDFIDRRDGLTPNTSPLASLLRHADSILPSDPHLAARMYYHVMCRGPHFWGQDGGLSLAQIATLGIGSARCTHALGEVLPDLRENYNTLDTCKVECNCLDVLIAEVHFTWETSGALYDVLGRLEDAAKIELDPSRFKHNPSLCYPSFVDFIERRLEFECAELLQYFQPIPQVREMDP